MKAKQFWDLVKTGVITQSLATVMVLGVTLYLLATGQPVPNELWTINSLVLGYFFGAKLQAVASNSKKG